MMNNMETMETQEDESPSDQLVLLNGREMSALLHGRDVTTDAFDEYGRVVHTETTVINGSGQMPGFDEGTESDSSLGWKGRAIFNAAHISMLIACAAVAAYVTSRIPFEEVFVTEGAGLGFFELFFPIALMVVTLWSVLVSTALVRGDSR